MINLTPHQNKAFDSVMHWFHKTPEQEFVLAGYAGTGKTTMAKNIASKISGTVFCAYTGKAAEVLRSKGCEPAMTAHSALYKPYSKHYLIIKDLESDLKTAFGQQRDDIQREINKLKKTAGKMGFYDSLSDECKSASLIIADEYSMLSEKIIKDLRKTGKKYFILVIQCNFLQWRVKRY